MTPEEIVAKDQVTFTVKGMWVKYLADGEEKEIIIPQRLTQRELNAKYFKNEKLLDTRIATILVELPYSSIALDGHIDLSIHESKYIN